MGGGLQITRFLTRIIFFEKPCFWVDFYKSNHQIETLRTYARDSSSIKNNDVWNKYKRAKQGSIRTYNPDFGTSKA